MAYFRSYNDGQTKQIDDESVFMFQYVNPVTVQANNFNIQNWPLTSPHSISPYVRGRDITINGIPQSVDVVVSFEGTVHCWGWVQSRSPNSIVVRLYVSVLSDSNGSVTIRPWVNRVPSVSTQYGIRLRDGTSSNNIIYDSGAKVMRPLGFMHSQGYSGINTTGKSLAHIPQQWGTSGYRRIISGSVNSCQLAGSGGVYGYTRHEQWGSSYSFLKVNQNDRELIIDSYNSPTNYLGCYSTPWAFPDSSHSTMGNIRTLIIDVTNYGGGQLAPDPEPDPDQPESIINFTGPSNYIGEYTGSNTVVSLGIRYTNTGRVQLAYVAVSPTGGVGNYFEDIGGWADGYPISTSLASNYDVRFAQYPDSYGDWFPLTQDRTLTLRNVPSGSGTTTTPTSVQIRERANPSNSAGTSYSIGLQY